MQVTEKERDAQMEDMDTPAPTETIEDFVRDVGITIEALPIHENPYRHARDQESAYHYSCRMINENKWFIVYFSKGTGLRLWVAPPDEFEALGKPLHVPRVNVGCHYDGPLPPFEGENAEYDQSVYERCSIPDPPNVAEVLDCLANDSFTIETTGIFESWCAVMKGNPDSVHTRKIYEVCGHHRLKLHALLGSSRYHHLVHEMGRAIRVPEAPEVPNEEEDQDDN